jgi:hypothetical protein
MGGTQEDDNCHFEVVQYRETDKLGTPKLWIEDTSTSDCRHFQVKFCSFQGKSWGGYLRGNTS